MELVVDKLLPKIVSKHQFNICLQCVLLQKYKFLLLLVIIIQYVVKIGFVTDILISTHPLLFFSN